MENTFGHIIQRERKKQELSLSKLSAKVNNEINASYINRLESGEQQNPSFKIVCLLCSALNLDIREVFRSFNFENLISNYNEDAKFTIEELIRLHRVKIPNQERLLGKEEQEVIIDLINTVFSIIDSDRQLVQLSLLLHQVQKLRELQVRSEELFEVEISPFTFIFNIKVLLEENFSKREVEREIKEQINQNGTKLLNISDDLIIFQINNESWLAKKQKQLITFIAKHEQAISF